jgi:hypothetical protein
MSRQRDQDFDGELGEYEEEDDHPVLKPQPGKTLRVIDWMRALKLGAVLLSDCGGVVRHHRRFRCNRDHAQSRSKRRNCFCCVRHRAAPRFTCYRCSFDRCPAGPGARPSHLSHIFLATLRSNIRNS